MRKTKRTSFRFSSCANRYSAGYSGYANTADKNSVYEDDEDDESDEEPKRKNFSSKWKIFDHCFQLVCLHLLRPFRRRER